VLHLSQAVWGGDTKETKLLAKREKMRQTSATEYFSIIPESVLYADISSNAVRVYGVLRRHADKDDNTCHPGKGRIAALARMSERSVDRAVNELVAEGFVTIHHRRNPDNPEQYLSNQYVIHSTPRAGDPTPRADDPTPPALVTVPPRAGGAVTIVKEPEPINQTPFDTFWQIYPRKIARKKCEQWWHKHATDVASQILDAATTATKQWRQDNTEPRYIPHPYTWLNQERWKDHTPLPAPEKEVRPYDTQPTQCDTCDGTRYISTEDKHGRSWATPCKDCQ